MECQVLVRHLPDGALATHQALELCADVRSAILVPIQRNTAVSLCAAPQTPYLFTQVLLHLGPWPTGTEAAAARL